MTLLNSMQEMCCIGNFSFPVSYDVLMIAILFYWMMSLLYLMKRKFAKHKIKLFPSMLVVYSGKIHTVLQNYFVYTRPSVLCEKNKTISDCYASSVHAVERKTKLLCRWCPTALHSRGQQAEFLNLRPLWVRSKKDFTDPLYRLYRGNWSLSTLWFFKMVNLGNLSSTEFRK